MTLQATVYQHLFIIVLITLFFYAFIPLVGAFLVRMGWRRFRYQLIKASLQKNISYKDVYGNEPSGYYRFFGSLQALEGENILWLTNSDVSVGIDLEGVPLYMLPSASSDMPLSKNLNYPDKSPKKTYWNRIFAIPEKTSFFISGKFIQNKGFPQFINTKEDPLLVIIFECDISNFYSHAILSGRQRNEYWNSLTPGALTIGSFSLFIYFYLLIQMPYMHFVAVTALSFSLVPVMPFFPPGLLLYYIYRSFWKKARNLRAERDLLKLPLNFFTKSGGLSETQSVTLANGNTYNCYIRKTKEEALSILKKPVLRKSSLNQKINEYFVFGTEPQNDPFAETLLIPGDPEFLSKESTRIARKYEIISALNFAAGFIINFIIFLSAITFFIR
ncbi:MAG: hypothetical protein J7L71_08525 [Spirochaetaceae bacterium]|nr:hypothetical protein [Spirochaetaceae bacterium]